MQSHRDCRMPFELNYAAIGVVQHGVLGFFDFNSSDNSDGH